MPQQSGRRARTGGRTPQLDRFGRDLTEEARRGGLDPVIGRAVEIEQVLEVLARRCAVPGWWRSTWPAWSPAPATGATSSSG